jgi:hypothetical protein
MSLSPTLRKLIQLPEWLDWLLSVVEPLVVLAITVVIFYTGYCLVFGSEQSSHLARFKDLMKEVNDNWKAGLLLLVLLFYRTIRTFLEQAEEAFSIKKKKSLPGEAKEGTTPPTGKN